MDGATRRRLLAALVGTGATALAGCLGSLGGDTSPDGDATDDRTPTATRSPTSTSTPTATDGETPSDTDTPTPTTTATATPRPNAPEWQRASLRDARTLEFFSLATLETPILLETFATWCPACRQQQAAIQTLLSRRDDVTAVSLNTDPNENATQVLQHAEENGFEWRFAVARAAFTETLVDVFGPTVTSPPQAPVIRICDGDSTLLPDGVKDADRLAAALEDC